MSLQSFIPSGGFPTPGQTGPRRRKRVPKWIFVVGGLVLLAAGIVAFRHSQSANAADEPDVPVSLGISASSQAANPGAAPITASRFLVAPPATAPQVVCIGSAVADRQMGEPAASPVETLANEVSSLPAAKGNVPTLTPLRAVAGHDVWVRIAQGDSFRSGGQASVTRHLMIPGVAGINAAAPKLTDDEFAEKKHARRGAADTVMEQRKARRDAISEAGSKVRGLGDVTSHGDSDVLSCLLALSDAAASGDAAVNALVIADVIAASGMTADAESRSLTGNLAHVQQLSVVTTCSGDSVTCAKAGERFTDTVTGLGLARSSLTMHRAETTTEVISDFIDHT